MPDKLHLNLKDVQLYFFKQLSYEMVSITT